MDLLDVLPDFDLKPHTHLLHSLDKNNVSVSQLVALAPTEIARICPLPPRDVDRLVRDIVKALQQDLLRGVKRKRKNTADTPGGRQPEATGTKVNEQTGVSTSDLNFDRALNEGIRPGHITEVVGESRTGKTTFALGLLLSVQLAPPVGLGKAGIFITSEGPLNTKRLNQMLSSYADVLPEQRPSLDRVHTITVTDLEAQEHILRYQLPVAISRYNVGLVVLDSVTANFRAEYGTRTAAQLADRAAQLTNLGNTLRQLAIEHDIAVVVTNQVSDRFDDSKHLFRSSPAATSSPAASLQNLPPAVAERRQETQSLDHQQRFFTGWGDDKGNTQHEQLKTPALGLAWANQISARIVLKMESERQEYAGGSVWKDKNPSRTFAVVFAPWAPTTKPPIRYEIAAQGIVSITAPEKRVGASKVTDGEHAELLDEALWATDEDDEFP
ncbi:DNA repair protein rhp57 [Cladophialophora carrionii]|uniref:DNA repair protein rhp57 n=1 Tax=Cladophialophora carrionii TaxID=86049 RepID=A0A1C1CAG7_9EURO|nr:DNA repair protein rhp57 [Cladophialophora carrionii]